MQRIVQWVLQTFAVCRFTFHDIVPAQKVFHDPIHHSVFNKEQTGRRFIYTGAHHMGRLFGEQAAHRCRA
jgi:hypothetical protein